MGEISAKVKAKWHLEWWLRDRVREGSELLDPNRFLNTLSSDITLTQQELYELLADFVLDGRIVFKMVVFCLHEDESHEILYEKVSVIEEGMIKIDVGEYYEKEVVCPTCQKAQTIDSHHLFMFISPTPEYQAYEMEQKQHPKRNRLKLQP